MPYSNTMITQENVNNMREGITWGQMDMLRYIEEAFNRLKPECIDAKQAKRIIRMAHRYRQNARIARNGPRIPCAGRRSAKSSRPNR